MELWAQEHMNKYNLKWHVSPNTGMSSGLENTIGITFSLQWNVTEQFHTWKNSPAEVSVNTLFIVSPTIIHQNWALICPTTGWVTEERGKCTYCRFNYKVGIALLEF